MKNYEDPITGGPQKGNTTTKRVHVIDEENGKIKKVF